MPTRVTTALQIQQEHKKNAKYLENIKRHKSVLYSVIVTCASGASLWLVFMSPVKSDLTSNMYKTKNSIPVPETQHKSDLLWKWTKKLIKES